MFIDYEKYIKILYPEMTDEEILESMDRYGKEVNNEKLYAREVLCFCHDCNKIFDETLQYDKEHELEIKDTITADEALTNEVLTSMGITKDELNAAINSCITPVGTHKYESGKCIYCEQAEPHEEETTAAPEEPTTKVEEPTTKTEEPTTKTEEPTTKANNTEKEKNSFLDDIVDFFKKVGDWLRDLFSFKLIRSLFK